MNLFKKNAEKADPVISAETKKVHRKVDKRGLMNGAFASAMAVVIIAAIVFVNMIVGTLPSDKTEFDMSAGKIFTIGDSTKEVLDGLGKDVTMNYLIQAGNEDTRIERLLDSYEAASERVKVKKIDIVANPTFYKEYTENAVQPNSVIVTAGEKSKVIDNYSIYKQDYATNSYTFDGEGQLTSAIAYVADDNASKAFNVTGHNEVPLSASMTDLLQKSNIEVSDLNLLSTDVPEDCDLLILFAPQTDLTENEAKEVRSYLEKGGKALIVSVAAAVETPNFDSILSAYGMTRVPGYVVEGDKNHYTQAPFILIPDVASADVTEKVTGMNIIDAYAQGVTISTDDDDLTYTATPILTTSGEAFSKPLDAQSIEKEQTDVGGPFALGVKIEENLSEGDDGEPDVEVEKKEEQKDEDDKTPRTRILYYTSPCLFSSDALSSFLQMYVETPEGNSQLFSDSITYLTDREVSVSIPAKSMEEPRITVPEGTSNLLGKLLMFVLPLAVLGAGVVVTVLRSRR